jgi:transcriptional regulator with GAF, ATPase, and Fis domain
MPRRARAQNPMLKLRELVVSYLATLVEEVQGAHNALATALEAMAAQHILVISVKRSLIMIEAEGSAIPDQTDVRIQPRQFFEGDIMCSIVEMVAKAKTPLAIDDVEVLSPHDAFFTSLLPHANSLICIPVTLSRKVIGTIILIGKNASQLKLADQHALEVMARGLIVWIRYPYCTEKMKKTRDTVMRAECTLDTIRCEMRAVIHRNQSSTADFAEPADIYTKLSAMLESEESGVRWLRSKAHPEN